MVRDPADGRVAVAGSLQPHVAQPDRGGSYWEPGCGGTRGTKWTEATAVGETAPRSSPFTITVLMPPARSTTSRARWRERRPTGPGARRPRRPAGSIAVGRGWRRWPPRRSRRVAGGADPADEGGPDGVQPHEQQDDAESRLHVPAGASASTDRGPDRRWRRRDLLLLILVLPWTRRGSDRGSRPGCSNPSRSSATTATRASRWYAPAISRGRRRERRLGRRDPLRRVGVDGCFGFGRGLFRP